MKAAKANPMKVHKTSSKKIEANKKTSASTISEGDIDHKAASKEAKIKGTDHLMPIIKKVESQTLNLLLLCTLIIKDTCFLR